MKFLMAVNNTSGSGSSFKPRTLIDLLLHRAEYQPERLAYSFLLDGESEEISVTYAQLDRRARAIGAWLQTKEASGERVLLLYPPGLDYIAAFFGCLYAGSTAVPAYPPRLNRPVPRIQAIVADAKPKVTLTTTAILSNIEKRFEHTPDLKALNWLNTDEIPPDLDLAWQFPEVSPDTLAFLQYTSGSTSQPKGVMLSHANLMHNLKVIRHGFQIRDQGRGVFWLPSYHDMGLIGGVLEPMYVAGPSQLMSPVSFLQRPFRWLQAITRFKGTISGAPNFAYDLCVEKITKDQIKTLDLSSWRLAFCGAEPVRPETLDRFAETFEPCGFRKQAFYPCYGLAEGTLLVSGGEGPGEPLTFSLKRSALEQDRVVTARPEQEKDALTMVSCGRTLLDQQITIVNPERLTSCKPNQVGEIWVSGPSIAQGYWNNPSDTKQAFQAFLQDTGGGPYLRTGDMGFLRNGELYITGRLKDMIIIHGLNHYPQDIELTVEKSHPALQPSGGAAFSVPIEDEEHLVIVQELTRQHRKANVDQVVKAIRKAVAEEHDLQVYAILLVKPLSIPKTSSGKLKRHACKREFLKSQLDVIGEWKATVTKYPERESVDKETIFELSEPERLEISPSRVALESGSPFKETIQTWLVRHIANRLNLSPEEIDPQQPFVFYGLDSVQAVSLSGDLEIFLGRRLSPTLIWDYPSIDLLSEYLASEPSTSVLETKPIEVTSPTGSLPGSKEPIAVIGLGLRFPGAEHPEEFWQLLRDGVDAIQEVPSDRWDQDSFYDPDPSANGKAITRWGGFLDRVDLFDPQFFGISPREAGRMDPQQRLLLEVAWEALEHAGLAVDKLAGTTTGVFVGISSYDYSSFQFEDPQNIDAYSGTGNAHSIAANRLSYLLDLRGPSMAVDTACSSSLVAVHLACRSLQTGESNLALVGGVNLMLTPDLTITFSQARLMAADGRCKTFDARADGYVRGEGCGMLVLERLSDALREGDDILALIRGSAVNHDGRSNGLTAPNGLAQQSVIRQALKEAEVHPSQISYIEAHGTGTPLGDPIEVSALRAVLEEGRKDKQPCFLGSVKTNIGHLEAAAGVAGLIKVILALQHEEIPPHLHLEKVNPYIDLEGSPLEIATHNYPWLRDKQPRLAGVSSFGFGGTNAHVVVSEAPVIKKEVLLEAHRADMQVVSDRPVHILTLSAKSDLVLKQLADRFAERMAEAQAKQESLADVCFTANTGRKHFEHRLALIGDTFKKAQGSLEAFTAGKRVDNLIDGHILKGRKPKIAFLFTGQGSQYPGMGRLLYDTQPVFKNVLDSCAEILQPILEHLDEPMQEGSSPILQRTIFPAPGEKTLIHQTAYTQPTLFAFEYALAEMWRSWGLEPDLVMGHSVGEYVAACVAGVFNLEEGLRLIAERGRLMQSLPIDGMMAAVFATVDEVLPVLESYKELVSIAAANGPENTVISGEIQAVQQILKELAVMGISSKQLQVSHAFHSPLMEPILDDFVHTADQMHYSPPRIPLVSNLLGEILGGEDLPDAGYWQQHIRQPVKFEAGMHALSTKDPDIYLEIGPSPVLLGMGKRCLPKSDAKWLPSLRQDKNDWQVLLESLAKIYVMGAQVDWLAFDRDQLRRKVRLPTYPFERKSFWFGRSKRTTLVPEYSDDAISLDSHPLLGRRLRSPLEIYESEHSLDGEGDFEGLVNQMASEIAQQRFGPGSHRIEEVDWGKFIPDFHGAFTIQLLISDKSEDEFTYQLFILVDGENQWRLGAEGKVQRGEAGSSEDLRPASRSDSETSIDRTILVVDETERFSLIESYLHEQITAVLELDPTDLDNHHPLDRLGMDSLMAMEIKNRIENDLEIVLPIVNLLEGPTVDSLAKQAIEFLTAPLEGGFEAIPLKGFPESGDQPSEGFPLSYGQQALWFLHQLIPEGLSFNVAGAIRIRGKLDVSALHRAFQEVVDRHATLRTTFKAIFGQPFQQAQMEMPAPFKVVNASSWSERKLQDRLVFEAHRPFDLEDGPVFRVILFTRAPVSQEVQDDNDQEHVLLLSMDHIITDFWSMTLLAQEVITQYMSVVDGLPAHQLEPLPVQYTNYVRWQAEVLAGPEGERLWNYWQGQLGGDLPMLDLPTDRPRQPVQTFSGDSISLQMDSKILSGLKELAKKQGATLFMVLLAGFQALLHRYSGQDDFLVGTVTSGRNRSELSGLIGYFLNPVAIRADFSGDPTFIDYLQRVRETTLQAFEHQDYPPALLAERLGIKRDPSRPPLFETMFILQKAQMGVAQGLSPFALGFSGARLEINGLVLESMALGKQPAQFDLTLMMAEMEEGLAATMHYNTDLFEAETIQRLLQHFRVLLQKVVDDPHERVNSFQLLNQAERRRLLVDWNSTASEFPKDLCIHQMIEAQVVRTPQAIAVQAGEEYLTYLELDRRAQTLAFHLRSLGVGPETLVGVCVERSLDMLVSLLGVLKAGGAYVPLDPSYPPDRLAYILEDSRSKVLLTHKCLDLEFPNQDLTVVYLDADDKLLQTSVSPSLTLDQPKHDNLAYVIHTSGSTGKPKGVQITHRALVNFLYAMQKEPGMRGDDVLVSVTTLSFDIAGLELFLPLTLGAKVVIADQETVSDGLSLSRLLTRSGATIMQATPATWRMLLDSGWHPSKSLKMLCGGEALPHDLAERLLGGDGELWNLYGPTETTIWSSVYRVEHGTGTIPIGKPIANTRMYVLDDQMQPVPVGVVGDLYIGGEGVARGYLNRPDLTAERFIQDPFSGENEARLYRTGDLARYLPDGDIEFLGRGDNQVKVRGFRIELGEVEVALREYPDVLASVVIAMKDPSSENQLVGYLVSKQNKSRAEDGNGKGRVFLEQLRGFLRRKLPEYMIPAIFVVLDALPLTPNGKVDRRALPAPTRDREILGEAFVPPRTPLEWELANICSEVLDLPFDNGRSPIGVNDSFFDLGGHSLLAAKLVFQLREKYQVNLPLRRLFEQPTVAGLAHAIKIAKSAGYGYEIPIGEEDLAGNLFEGMTLEKLQAEAILDETISPGDLSFDPLAKPENIFITGASGFIGAFLLHDLLEKTQAVMHCLVRADGIDEGFDRIKNNLVDYELWNKSFEGRIVPILGDLSQPRFGLSQSQFSDLSKEIDWIYHNGALVNFVYSYQAHKTSNVSGTEEILRLATSFKLKPVHFVSTLSIFHTGQADHAEKFSESDDLNQNGIPFGGYAQSKWVAEHLLKIAESRGVPVTTYRLGLVSGSSLTGAWNTNDMISSLSQACFALGSIPELDVMVNIVPVDYVSAAIVYLSQQPQSIGKVFHIDNPHPCHFNELLDWLRARNLPFRLVPFKRWQSDLIERALRSDTSGWSAFVPLIEEVDEAQVFMPYFDQSNTLAQIEGSSVSCAPVGPELIGTYLAYFTRQGLLESLRSNLNEG